MTDENLTDLGLDTQSQVPSAPVEQVQEKMLPQSQVNKIVSREVHEAREKAKREYQAELRAQLEAQTQGSMGGMRQMNIDDIDRLIAEKIQQNLQDHHNANVERMRHEYGQKIANEFVQKMEMGKSKYPDFDKVVGEVDFTTIPKIVELTHNLDNASDVVYDLMSNPQKVATILTLANTNELLARRSISDLSNSIKINQSAAKTSNVNEPLSQLSPSTLGLDNGSMTIDDYRAQPWLRV